jgi:large subunit ribosomal protein L25
MDEMVVEATTRTKTGTAECRRMRHRGMIPGVMYGHGRHEHIAINLHDFNLLLHRIHSEHAVMKCTLDGAPVDVLVKDVQRNHVSHDIEHVDLLVVDLDETVTITVPVEIVGEADGVRNYGGVLELIRRELEVECKAKDIPDAIRVDVTPLKVHEVVHVKDIPAIEDVKLTDDEEAIVVTVAAPTVHEEVVPTEEEEIEEPEEPEVIGARKEETPEEQA